MAIRTAYSIPHTAYCILDADIHTFNAKQYQMIQS